MSKRVIFISLLLCLFGLWCGWDMIQSCLKSGRLVFNTSVFFFPAGCGLLLGHRHARTLASWTLGLFYLGLVLTVAAAAMATSGITNLPGNLVGLSLSSLLVAELIALALSMLIHWQLYTQPFDEHLTA